MPTNSKHILVVGGAGFIGSHMLLTLEEAGFTPIVLDNLSHGHAESVLNAKLIVGDMADSGLLDDLFKQYHFAAVMHFASFIEVGESVIEPLKYYQNNVAATINLLSAMQRHQVKNFIFSSTAAVYGEPEYTPIDEKHPLKPVNPYGRSKLMIEEILQDIAKTGNLHFAILRYFNAAGADPKARLRERHEPESHLIPIILEVASGKRAELKIFGRDYETADGTCIRDYVHVADLCEAHLLALHALLDGKESFVCNLGTGRGYSVLEVLAMVNKITHTKIQVIDSEKRAGDPAVLIANPTYAEKLLGFRPEFGLEEMVVHAFAALKRSSQ